MQILAVEICCLFDLHKGGQLDEELDEELDERLDGEQTCLVVS